MLTSDGQVILEEGRPRPVRQAGDALIRVCRSGFCNTDVEITKGYMGFSGRPIIGIKTTAHIIKQVPWPKMKHIIPTVHTRLLQC